MVMSFFWAFGACFEALLAWAIMPTLGWRYLVGISVLPLVCFILFSPLIPESLLYLSVSGQKKKAEKLIAKVRITNRYGFSFKPVFNNIYSGQGKFKF
jgi:MFS family permease